MERGENLRRRRADHRQAQKMRRRNSRRRGGIFGKYSNARQGERTKEIWFGKRRANSDFRAAARRAKVPGFSEDRVQKGVSYQSERRGTDYQAGPREAEKAITGLRKKESGLSSILGSLLTKEKHEGTKKASPG